MAWSWGPVFKNQKHLIFRLAWARHMNDIVKLKTGFSHGVLWVYTRRWQEIEEECKKQTTTQCCECAPSICKTSRVLPPFLWRVSGHSLPIVPGLLLVILPFLLLLSSQHLLSPLSLSKQIHEHILLPASLDAPFPPLLNKFLERTYHPPLIPYSSIHVSGLISLDLEASLVRSSLPPLAFSDSLCQVSAPPRSTPASSCCHGLEYNVAVFPTCCYLQVTLPPHLMTQGSLEFPLLPLFQPSGIPSFMEPVLWHRPPLLFDCKWACWWCVADARTCWAVPYPLFAFQH